MEQIEDVRLEEFVRGGHQKIINQINIWNSQVYESGFARNFKQIFVRCKDFYQDEIDEESRKLTRLNTSITKLLAEDIDSEILDPLQRMVKDAQKNVNSLKDVLKKLKELQDEFFTEIKFISDVVGIAMPEPSEIDLLQDKIKNPLQLMEEYKKQKGIQTDHSMVDMLQNMFDEIEPIINKCQGGSEYRNELLDVILGICNIKASEVRINDVFQLKEFD